MRIRWLKYKRISRVISGPALAEIGFYGAYESHVKGCEHLSHKLAIAFIALGFIASFLCIILEVYMFENKLRIRGGVRDARRTEMVCLFSKGIRGI